MTAVTKIDTQQRKVSLSEFQLADHRYQRFDCTVPTGIDKENICNPVHWVNVANKLKVFDEIRAISEDQTFVAYLMVVFVQGTDVKLRLIGGADLENLDDEYSTASGKYDVRLRGVHKYCVINMETGDIIKQDIATKAQAYKELEDYVKALNS